MLLTLSRTLLTQSTVFLSSLGPFRAQEVSSSILVLARSAMSSHAPAKSAAKSEKTPAESGAASSKSAAAAASSAGKVRKVEVEKSPNDNRDYRGLVLGNGLKVLLVSDTKTDKSAAALDVHVGHMRDPTELPGLAHFCEHMLFLGTDKYPDENEYGKFLSQHGGGSNAYTSGEHTNYYFDVSPQHLEAAFDRFAQFFLRPLFTESATDREVKAVNSEHEKNVASDNWRLNQLQHHLCDPEHDYKKFGTGNKETLYEIPKEKGIKVREELLKFHSQWYSSNIMALTILGKEPLDDLEKMVTERFTAVENKNVDVPMWEKNPIRNPEETGKMLYVVPVKNLRNLNITFPIHDLQPHYRSSPGHYLGHLIGHEGKGSLLSELKRRGWASSLVGGQKHGARGFGFFIVNLDLSEEGIKHVDEIVSLVFQYMKMLRMSGPQDWVFEECKKICNMQFQFKDKERPQSYVSSCSHDLQYYPMEEALTGSYLLTEWRPELVEEVMDKLVPDNVRIAVIAQEFEDRAKETEPWYGTKYLEEDIPKEKISAWNEVEEAKDILHLPEKNEFIPDDFSLVDKDPEGSVPPHPVIIKETRLTRLWFKKDDEFFLPKANCNFELRSTVAYSCPANANKTTMFMSTFRDALNEYAYDAELAGLGYSISSTKHGVNLYLRGYSQKQVVLLEKVLEAMVSFKPNPDRFMVLKENYERGLKNFRMEQPHQHAVYYDSLLLAQQAWEKQELLDALANITVEKVEAFIPELFSSVHIEGLVHGNVTEEQALGMVRIVEDKLEEAFTPMTLPPSLLRKDREIALNPGTNNRYVVTNDVHKSSCVENYYQQGTQSTHDNAILELLAQVIHEPCFDVLRTKEQLGYIVWSGVRRACGVQGLRVIVQSDRHPAYLDERIEHFLSSMEEHLVNMSEEEFEKHKSALIDRRLEKPKKLAGKTSEFWSEIVTQQLNFDRDRIETDEIREIHKEQVLGYFRRHFKAGAAERKKLSCYVLSMAKDGAGPKEGGLEEAEKRQVGDEAAVVRDPVEFKSSLQFSPLLPPFVDPKELIKRKAGGSKSAEKDKSKTEAEKSKKSSSEDKMSDKSVAENEIEEKSSSKKESKAADVEEGEKKSSSNQS